MGVERDIKTGELTHVYADAGHRTPAPEQAMTDCGFNKKLSDHDQAVVDDFSRFLKVAKTRPQVIIPIGWLPYCFGWPAPPVGYDKVPMTAWTLPA